MPASSTCVSQTVCNLCIVSARCTGFTLNHGSNDFIYVVDLEWSDERCLSIKRKYSEFQKLHWQLVKVFPELRQQQSDRRLSLKTSIKDDVTSLFAKDKRYLGESREKLLDDYLQRLLKQPERIRQCNLILSFFESRRTDPKPCTSNSPSEKSDSGIDLTNRARRPQTLLSSAGSYSNKIDGSQNTDGHYSDEDEYSSSATETDDETFDEDYFLDVGFGELMLHSPNEDYPVDSPCSPLDGQEPSMWCSNLDKFSNILRSSMSNLNAASDNHQKPLRTLTSIEDERCDVTLDDNALSQEENSDTESQINAEERQLDAIWSRETNLESKSCFKADMKQYYLSMDNLNLAD